MIMKKIAFVLVALMVSVAANAQFEKGKTYIGASLSSLNLSYCGSEKGHLALQAKGGYLFMDNLMATGQVGYEKMADVPYALSLGVGARYYIVQNGLFLGAGANYVHCDEFDDFRPTVQLGYAFFLSRTVTVEPEIYYEQSFKDHKEYSRVGFRIGFGIYL